MRVFPVSFQVPRAGNSEADCEDRYRLPKWVNEKKPKFRFAVADGATESAFSGTWAEILVDAYVNPPLFKPALTSAPKLCQMIEREAPGWAKKVWAKPLPWFVQEKVQRGAFSTLLGLSLENKTWSRTSGVWNALGVGDTCVFQVRGDNLIARFPVERAEQFGNHPVLISTKPESNIVLTEHIHTDDGVWQTGDRFLLMTDALAHWFLSQVEAGEKPWLTDLREGAFTDPGQFMEWVGNLRVAKNIRNDDVTLLMIRVER